MEKSKLDTWNMIRGYVLLERVLTADSLINEIRTCPNNIAINKMETAI